MVKRIHHIVLQRMVLRQMRCSLCRSCRQTPLCGTCDWFGMRSPTGVLLRPHNWILTKLDAVCYTTTHLLLGRVKMMTHKDHALPRSLETLSIPLPLLACRLPRGHLPHHHVCPPLLLQSLKLPQHNPLPATHCLP